MALLKVQFQHQASLDEVQYTSPAVGGGFCADVLRRAGRVALRSVSHRAELRRPDGSRAEARQWLRRAIRSRPAGGAGLAQHLAEPANPKAYDNLKAARKAYDKAYDKAYQELGTVAAGTAFEAPTRALAELGAAQSAAQDAVLALARQDQPGAIAALNAKETPAWRAPRAKLLKHGEEARKTAAAAHEDTRRAAARARTLAVLAAGLFLLLSQRTVRRELGGEPPDWAGPQPSFTTGSSWPGAGSHEGQQSGHPTWVSSVWR